jgi:lipopolysaccharide export system ATP-binding protein
MVENSPMGILQAQNLAKRYRSRTVVSDVSLTVESGEVVGLLGPNGAGKTTSFYMIVGLTPSDAGNVLLDGKDLTRHPMHRRARMGLGYLPQEPSVFRRLTVAENLMAILETRSRMTKAARRGRLAELLRALNIGHLRDSSGESLSGGERRRVEIARALATDPRFILFDEPFAGVDPISVQDIQRIIEQLAATGIGVLVTDHNVRETLGICDRAYIVNEGRIIAAGSPETVLADKDVRTVYLGDEFRL